MLLTAFAVLVLGAAPLDSTASTHRPRAPRAERARRPATVETWQVDASRSEIAFRVRQFVSKIRGSFGEWTGSVVVDPRDWGTAQVGIDIRTASIDTRNERRDQVLRSPELFAADSFPVITFRSTRVERDGKSRLVIQGLLTMRGVTKPVLLEGRLLGLQRDAQGTQHASLAARGVVNRLDYGVAWNRVVEGSQMLGDEVELVITLELVRKDDVATR